MKAVPKVDANGLYIEDVIQDDTFSGIVPFYTDPTDKESSVISYLIGTAVPSGLYQPKWDLENNQWIEGMTQKEIDELNNQPVPISSDQRIKDLEQQNLSLMDATASMFEQLISVQAQIDKLSKS